jgi:hypothetical protein
VRRLESWDYWWDWTRSSPDSTTLASARKALEERISNLNREFAASAGWQGQAGMAATPRTFSGQFREDTMTLNRVHFQVRDLLPQSIGLRWFWN